MNILVYDSNCDHYRILDETKYREANGLERRRLEFVADYDRDWLAAMKFHRSVLESDEIANN